MNRPKMGRAARWALFCCGTLGVYIKLNLFSKNFFLRFEDYCECTLPFNEAFVRSFIYYDFSIGGYCPDWSTELYGRFAAKMRRDPAQQYFR